MFYYLYLTPTMAFYKTNFYYKFHEKNVMYIAYVGKIERQDIYKYGITRNLFKREYEQHRKTFNTFEMVHVKPTFHMAQAEDLFEMELKLRNLHRKLEFGGKQQIELFTLDDNYDIDYIKRLVNRISAHVDKDIYTIKRQRSK